MPNFDYHDALIQIEMLFQSHILSFGYKEYSLETFVDKKYFALWKGREGNADTDEMRAGLFIDGILRSTEPSEYEVLTYLQYTLNIAELCRRNFTAEEEVGYDFDIRNYTELLARIRELLQRLNYEAKYIEDKELIYLVPRNPAAEAVCETAPDEVTALVTQYQSSLLSGKLEKKQALLGEIADSVKEYGEEKRGNIRLAQKTSFLLDALNIRPQQGHEDYDRIKQMNADELEDWYDEAYQLLLLRILEHSNLTRMEKVDKLAKECGVEHFEITQEEMARLLAAPGVPEDMDSVQEEMPKKAEELPKEEPSAAPSSSGSSRASGAGTVRNVVIALIVADLLFAAFVLCYLFLV